MKRTSLVALTACLLILVPACDGGSDEVSDDAAQWASNMCESLGRFTSTVASITTQLQALSTQTDVPVKQKKQQFIALIDQGSQASETLIDSLRSNPAPDVEGGEQAIDSFVGQLEEMKSIFDDFSDRFSKIDTSKPKAAEEEALAAATEMQGRFVELQEHSGELTGIAPEIDRAINESPECQQVLGSPAPAGTP